VLVERYRKPQEARSQEMPPQVSPAPGTVTITVGQGGVGAYSIGSVTTNTTINNQH